MTKKSKNKQKTPYKVPLSQINNIDAETTWGTLAVPEAFTKLAIQKRELLALISLGKDVEST